MRRPAPLPTEQAPPEPSRKRAGRRSAVVDSSRFADEPAASDEPAGGDDRPRDIAEAPAVEEPMTSLDVWRAARARRKVLRAEIRRFTQRSRRRRILIPSVIAGIVLLVGGGAAAAYSPLFAVEKVTVVGTGALDPAAVEASLAGQIGTPLALVDSSEVKAALLAFPLIETYSLEAQPPHGLTVRIVERTPVGVMESESGFTVVDGAGIALATTPEKPADQPILRIDGGIDSAAFESAGLVMRSLPAEIRPTVTEVAASSADNVTLTLASGVEVMWGSSTESAKKAEVLARALVLAPDADTIDVSSAEVLVVG